MSPVNPIVGHTPSELRDAFTAAGLEGYRAAQVMRWLFRGVRDFGEMSDLSRELRVRLSREWCAGA